MRICFIIYLFVYAMNVALIFVPLNWQLLTSDQLKDGIRKASMDTYEHMIKEGDYFTGFSVSLFI